MTANGWLQIALFFLVVLALTSRSGRTCSASSKAIGSRCRASSAGWSGGCIACAA